jgi:hypothetical protein
MNGGVMLTAMSGVTVTDTEPDLVGSDTDDAVKVMFAEGTIKGGVYVRGAPDRLAVLLKLPQTLAVQELPAAVIVQVTPLFCGSPATLALT